MNVKDHNRMSVKDHPFNRMLEEDPMLRRIVMETINSMTLWDKIYYGAIGKWYSVLRFLRLHRKEWVD